MRLEATKALPQESGGILIGHFEPDTVVITQAGGPGLKAQRSRDRFTRDGDHAQKVLDRAVAAGHGAVDYIGEWHSHPANVRASEKDKRSMHWVSLDPGYKRKHPVLVVLRRVKDRWEIDAAQIVRGKLTSLHVQIAAEDAA